MDPKNDSLAPISLEMLAEELPQLLQSLLVGVEHAISRVPLDALTFPHKEDEIPQQEANAVAEIGYKQQTNRVVLSPIGSPKCGLKRRDIITKNKSINSRYALRRMSNKTEKKTGTETVNNDAEPSSMPLFCLGGSFPHIDSDEESGDDLIKTSQSGKWGRCQQ